MSEKLQKVLAQRGFGSRREMERWISAGRIIVNGETATVGERVDANDVIKVDGQRLKIAPVLVPRVLVMNKREGVICTHRDTQGRKTVFDDLPRIDRKRHGERWVTVGRLDVGTSGLLIFTNDGVLAHRLMHPSTGIDREYAVRLDGLLDEEALERLKIGVSIDGGIQRFSDVRYYDGRGNNHWYHAVLMEGKNREVRKLFRTEGRSVNRLKRVRYGPVVLPSWLKRGSVAQMGVSDLATLYALLQMPRTIARRRSPGTVTDRSLLIPYPELELTSAPTR
jgi:23S rRNA pseudouridine2605 synthase